MEEYRDIFVEEAREHLATIEKRLLDLEADPSNRDALNEIFRMAHTLKGMSATVGLNKLAEVAHRAESLLDQLRKGERGVDRPIMDLLLAARDRIAVGVEAIAASGTEPAYEDMIQRLEAAAAQPSAPPVGAAFTIKVMLDPATPLKAARGIIVVKTLERMGRVISSEPSLQAMVDGTGPESVTVAFEGSVPKDEIHTRLEALLDVRTVTIGGGAGSSTATGRQEGAGVQDAGPVTAPSPASPTGVSSSARATPPSEAAPSVPGETASTTSADASTSSGAKTQAAASQPPALSAKSTSGASTSPPATPKTTSIRVSTQQLETIVDTVGELVISKARLLEMSRQLEQPALLEALGRIDRLTSDLYDNVLKTRTLPLGTVYDRFPRMVRDLSAAQAKEVELAVKGRDIELDRAVMEELSEPLLHLLRNAIDHGVEPALEREKNGKPRKATVTIDTHREHNRVVIEVSDDGRGIDPERIKRKAIEKNIVSQREAEGLSLNDTYLLLCRPGFSTAEKVTSTSGRGVGMDVVKNWVESVGGSLRIGSELGKGSRFTLRLPLTLAILQGLIARVGSERYVLSIDAVEATVDLVETGVRTIHGKEVFYHGEDVVPLLRLSRLLAVQDAGEERYAIIVEKHGRKAGLAVDEVMGQQEVVVKNFDRSVIKSRELGGATVLGDGTVALILDVAGIMES